MNGTIRIAMWSGPRNISTAMMRAWGNRADCRVMDEPFYGAYLATTRKPHPMRDEVVAAMETGWDRVAETCASAADAPVVYQKHMCQHMLPGTPREWMKSCRHAFLIRPPEAVAASFKRRWDGMAEEDLGFVQQAELFDEITALTGRRPPVVEARDVLEAPEASLRALCAALEVPFDPAMLEWAPGRRDTDGVWAPHWYAAVEASTGFAPYRDPGPAPEELAGIVASCRPAYERLAAERLCPAP